MTLKRLLAIFLVLVSVISLIPVTPVFAEGTATGYGGGAGAMLSQNGGGTWTRKNYGFRIYIVDENLKIVSNVIDFVSQKNMVNDIKDPTQVVNPYVTKVGAIPKKTNGNYDYNVYWMKEEKLINSYFYKVVSSIGGQSVSTGNEHKAWMLTGTGNVTDNPDENGGTYRPRTNTGGSTGGSGGGSGGSGGSGSSGGSTTVTTPTQKISDLSTVIESLSSYPVNTVKDYYLQLKVSYDRAYNSILAALKQHYYTVISMCTDTQKEIVNKTYINTVNAFRASCIPNINKIMGYEFPTNTQVVNYKAACDYLNNFKKHSISKGQFNAYIYSLNVTSYQRQKLIEYYNYLVRTGGGGSQPIPIAQNLGFIFAYADTDNDDVGNENGNLQKILNASIDGNYIFHFNNGIKVESSRDYHKRIGDSDWEDYQELNAITTTCWLHGYRVIVEAQWFFTPEKYYNGSRQDPYNKVFYGSPYAYGMWQTHTSDVDYSGNWGGWIDTLNENGGKGKGGNYNHYNNKLCPKAMSLYSADGKDYALYKAGESTPTITMINMDNFNNPVTNEYLADTTEGINMHWYGFGEVPSPLPEVPTYDPEYIPDDAPHPAPDKDPEPDDPDEVIEHYNITIVKYYEKKLSDDLYELVEITVQEQEPDIISVQHEKKYKVVDYFSSNSFEMPMTWNELRSLIPTSQRGYNKTLDYNKFVTAGTELEKVYIGLSADEDASDNIKNSTVLYVHLVYEEEEPNTHTWDRENKPDGTPGDAPNPDTDPYSVPAENSEDYKYRIIKVYDTKTVNADGDIESVETDGIFSNVLAPAKIYIEDEPMYRLQGVAWKSGNSAYTGSQSDSWETVISGVPSSNTLDLSPYTRGDFNYFVYSNAFNGAVFDEGNGATLYVHLSRVISPENNILPADLTQSQLTRIVTSGNSIFEYLESHKFTATGDATPYTGHSFTVTVPCEHYKTNADGTFELDASGNKIPLHSNDTSTATHWNVSRAYGDKTLEFTTGISERAAAYETDINSGEFKGMIYANNELKDNGVLSHTVNDGAISINAILNRDFTYVTTVSRHKVNDNPLIAKYKEADIDADTLERISKYYNDGNTYIVNTRSTEHTIAGTLSFKLNVVLSDNSVRADCYYDDYTGDATIAVLDHNDVEISGDYQVHVYTGRNKGVANATSTDYVSYAHAVFVNQQDSLIKFYPYIKMSYQVTADYIDNNFEYDEQPNGTNRAIYMLSNKESSILPTDAVTINWYSETYGGVNDTLQMISSQWSTHREATNGTENWKQSTRVLPGGAMYSLTTRNTLASIATVTYNHLISSDSSSWISNSNMSKLSAEYVYNETSEYFNEAEEVIDNYKIVQWVQKIDNWNNWTENTTAWSNTSKAVKIVDDTESLSNLGLIGNASNDDKYRLGYDSDTDEASEGDIDILNKHLDTMFYKVFTDVHGNVYVLTYTISGTVDNANTLNWYANRLDNINSTRNGTVGTFADGVYGSYTIRLLGNKNKSTSDIIRTLTGDLADIESNTKYFTNSINAVTRNAGYDPNATWVSDGKWYNEAFDGIYMVVQRMTYNVGFGIPQIRINTLDPKLSPVKNSTSKVFTEAFLSQFCLNNRSSIDGADLKPEHYIGTFEGMEVCLPDIEELFVSRSFFIPNANVQDLT